MADKNLTNAKRVKNDEFYTQYSDVRKEIELYFRKYFKYVEKHKTWPQEDTEYGDCYFILKK